MRPQKSNYSSTLLAGFRAVQEAIDAGKELDKVFVQKGLSGQLYHDTLRLLKERGIPFSIVPPEKLQRMTRANHQGIVAFVSAVAFQSLEEIISRTYEEGRDPRILLLDGVTDVRNFGAICRTAECHGVDAVVIPEKGAAQINDDAIKTSTGAILLLNICRVKSLTGAIDFMQKSGIRCVAATEKGADFPEGVQMSGPLCLIMGAEETGVSPEVMRKVESMVRIPMEGRTQSMNVSVACGIMLYEMNRQRRSS